MSFICSQFIKSINKSRMSQKSKIKAPISAQQQQKQFVNLKNLQKLKNPLSLQDKIEKKTMHL